MPPPKRRRACEACHSAKVRCELSLPKSQALPPCKRCRKAGKECFPATPRLQRNRIAALETQVQALTEALEVQRSLRVPLPLPDLPGCSDNIESTQDHQRLIDSEHVATTPSPLIQFALSVGLTGPSLPQPADIYQARSRTAEFRQQMSSLSISAPEASEPLSLFHRHVAVIYLNEVILHTPTNKETFWPPYIAERIAAADFAAPTVTIDHIGVLYTVKDSCHAALDQALEVDPASSSPLLSEAFYLRVQYAVFILIKLYVAVTAPGNTYGTVLSNAELRLEVYLEKLRSRFCTSTTEDSLASRNSASSSFGLLEDWFIHYKAIVQQYERRMSLNWVWTPSMPPARQKSNSPVQSSDESVIPKDLVWIDETRGKQDTWKHSHLPRMEASIQEHMSR